MSNDINVFDVAAYILQKRGPMTTWKLQKLVYYSQAWSLVWDDDVLFREEIEAWANGPVVRELYDFHRKNYHIGSVRNRGSAGKLNDEQRETIDVVLRSYGNKSPQWLSDMTHMEDPWENARRGVPDGVRSSNVIPKADLAEYYASLLPA